MKKFNKPIIIGRPNIGNKNKLNKYFSDILDNKWLTNNGPYVQKFERGVEQYLNVKHCIAVCNATTGLEIAMRALNLKGEVIMPSFTFIATPHSAKWQGLTPVFCDVDPQTHNIDPKKITDLITDNTTGIVGVHLWGRSCDTKSIMSIANEYKLKVLFDAAHAFGCSHNGHMIGNFGDAEVFSFHATKFFNTFEGGAITTNDNKLAEKIRLMKNFGFLPNGDVVSLGINGKMNEISAAMGLVGLQSINHFVKVNYKNYKCYQKHLDGVKLLQYNEDERCNYQYIVIEVNNRDELMNALKEKNIVTKRYFYPGCHNNKPYSDNPISLPETDILSNRTLVLPTGTSVTKKEIKKICKFIIKEMA